MKKLKPKPDDSTYTVVSALNSSGAISVSPAPFELLVDIMVSWMNEIKITRGIYKAAIETLANNRVGSEKLIVHLLSTLIPNVVHELCLKEYILMLQSDYQVGRKMVWNNFEHQCKKEGVNPQEQWKKVASKAYVQTQIITLYMFPEFIDLAHLWNEILTVSKIGTEEFSGMEVLFTAAFVRQEVQRVADQEVVSQAKIIKVE